jgi:hypothetical protein
MTSRLKPGAKTLVSTQDAGEHFEDFSDGAPEECVYSQEHDRAPTGSLALSQQTTQDVESMPRARAGSDHSSLDGQPNVGPDLGKPGVVQRGIRAPVPPAIVIKSVDTTPRKPPGTVSTDPNTSGRDLTRIKFPPRPTSASSTSRRQLIQTLDNHLSPLADGPPLHSSQPVQFRAAKRGTAAFNSSAPRMLINVSPVLWLLLLQTCHLCFDFVRLS